MDGHGGWLALGSLHEGMTESADTGRAFFWAAVDLTHRTLGASGMIYAIFQVIQGGRGRSIDQ